MIADRYLVDTNVLLRLFVVKDRDSAICREAVARLLRRDTPLHFTLQDASEFWNVCTRPTASGGLAMQPADVSHALQVLLTQFSIVHDTEEVAPMWMTLVTQYEVRGVKVHDARLVAAMRVHRIPAILTLNDRDFHRFPGIEVLRPFEIYG